MKSESRKKARAPKSGKPAGKPPVPPSAETGPLANVPLGHASKEKTPVETALGAAAQPEIPHKGRTRTGIVISTKMQKTVVVNVEQRVAHPLYRKIVRRHKKLYAHDEAGVAKPGDQVKIQETRPLSRMKCWRLVEIVRTTAEEGAV